MLPTSRCKFVLEEVVGVDETISGDVERVFGDTLEVFITSPGNMK